MGWKNGLGAALVFLASAGCGSPGAAGGEVARPEDPSASDALGDKGTPGSGDCTRVSPQAAPFLADWKTDQRAELAATMQDGVAVLSYSCQGIKVLSDCKLDGEYRFAEVAIKKEDIEIDQSSDLAATLPVAAVEISAEVQRGLKLRLAYAMIGRNTTATGDAGEVAKSELKPKSKNACDGATHYVRWAWMGAFDFGTATEGSVSGGVKVLGAGAEGSSKSKRKLGRSDGDRNACKSSGGEKPADRAPSGCDAIVQLQLGPIVAEKTAASEDTAQAATAPDKATNPCSDGFVLAADGSCKKKSGAGAYLCDPKNVDECKTQCDKGSAESCYSAARAQYAKDAHPSFQEAEAAARPFYEKACDKNYYPGCRLLAASLSFGKDADHAKSRSLYEKGCTGGDSGSCISLASMVERPPMGPDSAKFIPNPTLAFGYTKKGCELGSSFACSLLAKRYVEGKGVLANVDEGLKTLDLSCAKQSQSACVERARFYATGDSGAKKDPTKALDLYTKACDKNSSTACIGAGDIVRAGSGSVKKDPEKARKFYTHACENLRSTRACTLLGNMNEHGEGAAKDEARAFELYKRSCPLDNFGTREGCFAAGAVLERGGSGITKDPKLAATYYLKGCGMDVEKTGLPEKSCKKATTLLGAQKRDAELRMALQMTCNYFKDKGACDKAKKLAPPPPPPPKGPPGLPKGPPGAPKGPPGPPPKAPPPPPPPTKN